MHSYWAYVLVGDNDTGKTTFQKYLVSHLCGEQPYQRLPSNLRKDIKHARVPRGVSTLSTMGRSFQENIENYRDIEYFFANHFKKADICILSSHARGRAIDHVTDMIRLLRLRAYNVAGVFFSNRYNNHAAQISLLDWDERLWLENRPADTVDLIERRIARLAYEFAQMLIARAALQ